MMWICGWNLSLREGKRLVVSLAQDAEISTSWCQGSHLPGRPLLSTYGHKKRYRRCVHKLMSCNGKKKICKEDKLYLKSKWQKSKEQFRSNSSNPPNVDNPPNDY